METAKSRDGEGMHNELSPIIVSTIKILAVDMSPSETPEDKISQTERDDLTCVFDKAEVGPPSLRHRDPIRKEAEEPLFSKTKGEFYIFHESIWLGNPPMSVRASFRKNWP